VEICDDKKRIRKDKEDPNHSFGGAFSKNQCKKEKEKRKPEGSS